MCMQLTSDLPRERASSPAEATSSDSSPSRKRKLYEAFVKIASIPALIEYLVSDKSSLLKMTTGLCAAPMLQTWIGDNMTSAAFLLISGPRAIFGLCKDVQEGLCLAVFAAITNLAIFALVYCLFQDREYTDHEQSTRPSQDLEHIDHEQSAYPSGEDRCMSHEQSMCLVILIRSVFTLVPGSESVMTGCPSDFSSNPICEIESVFTFLAFFLAILSLCLQASGAVLRAPWKTLLTVLHARRADRYIIVSTAAFCFSTLFTTLAGLLRAYEALSAEYSGD